MGRAIRKEGEPIYRRHSRNIPVPMKVSTELILIQRITCACSRAARGGSKHPLLIGVFLNAPFHPSSN